MDPNQNRPRGRQKNLTSGGSGAYKRGDGLGTGQVGSADHSAAKPSGNRPVGSPQHHSSSTVKRAAIGGGGGIGLILMLVALFLLLKLFGGGVGGGGSADINDLVNGMLAGGSGDAPSGFSFSNDDINTGGSYEDTPTEVDETVVSGARAKRTRIIGNNNDKVTIMLYMCGTDLLSLIHI